jgi:hypothetical protein
METDNQYWEGHKNDNCLKLPAGGIQSRIVLFEKHLKGKRVLHLGCSDWPYTEEKTKNKKLLHQYISGFTKELYGIDSCLESINIMRKNGIKDVFVGDIYNLYNDENIINKKFDVLVVSEIIEHLVNPGLALESVKKYILKTNPKCEIIFTVPNYHNFYFTFLSGLRGQECVHPDHKFYFSYRTFRNLIENFNFKVDDFYFVTYGAGLKTLKGRILSGTILKFLKCMAPHLYFKCSINNEK